MYGVPDCSENEDGQDHRHVKSYRWVATLFGCLALGPPCPDAHVEFFPPWSCNCQGGTCCWLGHPFAQDSVGMPCQEFSPHCLRRSLCQACCETGYRPDCSPLGGSCLLFWVRFWQGPSGSFVYCQACGAVLGRYSQWCPVCSAWLVAGFWLVVRECHPVVSARSLACLYCLQCFAPPVGFAAFTAAIWAVRFRVVVWPTASKVAVIVQRCLAAWLPPALSNSHKLGSCKGNTRRLLLQPCPCGLSGLLTMQFLFIRLLLKPSDFCLRLFRCLFGAQHQCCQVLRPGVLPFLRFAWLLGSVPCGGDLQVSRLAFSGHWWGRPYGGSTL